MKVCLNAFDFQPGKMGGTETYFRELVRHLPTIGENSSFVICSDIKHQKEFSQSPGVSFTGIVTYKRPDPRWLVLRALQGFAGVDLYAGVIAKIKSDVIHFPFSVMTPRILDRPSVLSFWDMQHEYYPQFFSRKELEYRNKIYKRSVIQATRVIVSAEFTRSCLMERYGIDENKIDVIYTGYAPNYGLINDDAEMNHIRQHYGLTRPFMYYPAATWPHKNHCTLLDAVKLLVDRWKFDGMLVLSGIAMQNNSEVVQQIQSLGLESHVKVLGYLPYPELPYLYNMARLLVFPSLFEGFGIPLVEAMACGCPVVASNCTSIPEVIGDAGTMFDPSSAEDIAATLWRTWNNDAELDSMRAKGVKRVTRFSWQETARRTLDVYHKSLR